MQEERDVGPAVRSDPEVLVPARSRPVRWLWSGLGFVCVGLGTLGVVVPGLPTTVFFVLAASCFMRSSPRLEQWVLNLPGVGVMVRDHRAGLGMPVRAKVAAIGTIVLVGGVSALVLLQAAVARVAVLTAVLVGVWYLGWRVPTREGAPAAGRSSPPSVS